MSEELERILKEYDLKAILKAVHRRCTKHRDEINQADACGCFYCQKLFHPSEIREWTDQGTTALCPHCGIDSVLPSTEDHPVSELLLELMEAYWFGEAD